MERQMDFKSDVTFAIYLKMKCLMSIGAGSEGECFKSNSDKDAYKIFFNDEMLFTGKDYDVSKIITTHEVDLNSFAFPGTLDAAKGSAILPQCKMTDLPPSEGCVFLPSSDRNLFSTESTLDITNIYNINFRSLIKAYLRMKADVVALSEKHIAIYDLPFNLMFDGQKLIAIDTCGYYKTDESVLKNNLKSLDDAITSVFDLWLRNEEIEGLSRLEKEDMISYLMRLDVYLKSLKRKIKGKYY